MGTTAQRLSKISTGDKRLLLRVVSEDLEFARLADEWNDLAEDCPDCDFFVSWHWAHAWWIEYGNGLDLRIYTVRDNDGKLLGVLPTYLRHLTAFRWIDYYELRFIGTGVRQGPSTGYFDLIARPRDRARVTSTIIPSLLSEAAVWDLLTLDTMPAESPLTRRLPNEMPGHIFGQGRRQGALVELPPDWLMYLDCLEPEHRDGVRFARERFSFDKNLSCTRNTEPAELNTAVKTLLRLAELRTHRSVDEKYLGFVQRVIREQDSRSFLCAYTIRRGSKPIAILLTYDWRKTTYIGEFGVAQGEDEDALFKVLASNAIEAAIDNGGARCDFLFSQLESARQMGPQIRETVTLGANRTGGRERLINLSRRFGRR